MITVLCGNCNSVLEEPSDIPIESRNPCTQCGSTARKLDVSVAGTLNLYSKLKYKGRHQDKGKPFIKGVVGSDFFRKLGKWVRLVRTIDRENDLYKEVITDPSTGIEIHRNQEPLSQHIGHGDDKKNRKN